MKGERVTADHDVLNPFAGELLQQLSEVGGRFMLRVLQAHLLVHSSKTQPIRCSGLMSSQKSVEIRSISDWLRATPPVQVRRRSAARGLERTQVHCSRSAQARPVRPSAVVQHAARLLTRATTARNSAQSAWSDHGCGP